jgi:signal transduction histidine kinase/CheY-like chemotaxis protein
MEQGWRSLFEVAQSVFLFALITQCALAWLFTLLFVTFLRAADRPSYFRAWTWSSGARALALTAILVRFTVPVAQGTAPQVLDGSAYSDASYFLYQGGKFLTNWWLLEGVLLFVGRPVPSRVARSVPFALAGAAGLTVLLSKSVVTLLLFQFPVVLGFGLFALHRLLRLAPSRRSIGTRLTATALGVQGLLWCLYFVAFLRADGPWPVVSNAWTILSAHNSYFDLATDVLLASGLVVLLFQDLHRRQLEAEAERYRLRNEIDRSAKLRSLGTLVSGVAHELNNPLASILGFAEALALPDGDVDRVRSAEIIREQALRCRRIVRGLSTFSGKGSEVLEQCDVRELFERVLRGLEFELGRKAVAPVIASPERPTAFCGDRFALEQMLANLVANAIQASPPGGTVRLSARAAGGEIELAVEDDGPGIPTEIRARIFDPFFSTRPYGEGMGLGLAVVHGIVAAHGGTIRVEDGQPRGTRMVVSLPMERSAGRVRAAPAPEPRGALPSTRVDRRELDLLVIEDEASLCDLLNVLARRRGWRVSFARNGREGLERLRSEGERFDVVLCDLRMAPPSGMDIHDHVLAERPQLLERFLFMTGDLTSREAAEFTVRCRRPILAKPLEIQKLASSVEDLVAAR